MFYFKTKIIYCSIDEKKMQCQFRSKKSLEYSNIFVTKLF